MLNILKPETKGDLEMFVRYDSKTGRYGAPTYALNQHDLVRQICNMYRDPRHHEAEVYINAEDFSVHSVGFFCNKTGNVTLHKMAHVANFQDLKTMVQLENKPVGIPAT